MHVWKNVILIGVSLTLSPVKVLTSRVHP